MRVTSTLFALALSTPAWAQDTGAGLGSITGTLGLEPAEWVVVEGDGGDGSYWRRTDDGIDIRMQGRFADAGTAGGTLVVGFSMTGPLNAPDLGDPSIAFERGADAPIYVADDEGIDLGVTAVTITGDTMSLSGSFAGTLTPGNEPEPLPDTESLTIDGNFQALLREGD